MGKPDPLAEAFADAPQRAGIDPLCPVGRILANASVAGRERLQLWLDSDASDREIYDRLRATGIAVGKGTVADHRPTVNRRAKCRCPQRNDSP